MIHKINRLSLAFTLALTLSLLLTTLGLAAVWTDQQDYSPGDIVTIHGDNSDGAGYEAGETVQVEVSGPNGYEASCQAVADDAGAWSCQVTLFPDYLAVGTYTYTATGATSGVSQSGMFTDGNLKFHETGLPNGTSWTVTWNDEDKTDTAPNDVVFGGPLLENKSFGVASPLSGVTGVQYVASPTSGTATRPQSGNTTVNITFTTQYQVAFAVNPSGGGSISPSATDYYNAGSILSISATPNAGYVFSSWSASTSSITFASASSASTTATINGTGTITANFTLSDSTPPTTSIILDPSTPDGNNDWYVTDVHVTVSAVDNAGGTGVAETRCVLDPASAPATFDDIPSGCAYTGAGADVTTDGEHTIYAASKDGAGNKETPTSKSFKIDKTAPTLTLVFTPDSPDGNNGWWKTPGGVPFAWTCSDATSGIDTTFGGGCPSPLSGTVTAQGTTNFSDQVRDMAGNLSAAVNRDLKLDNVAPVIVISSPINDGTYILNAAVPSDYSCTDATSGMATCNGPVASGANFDTSTVGTKSFTVNAADQAGNSSSLTHTYSVQYNFAGFFAPIDMTIVNSAKAGQAIPIKWRLTDAYGNPVSDPLSFVSVTSSTAVGVCGGTTDEIETYAGSSGLQYLGDGYWQFNWKTPKTYAGQCRTMRLNLSDGVLTRTAQFTFK